VTRRSVFLGFVCNNRCLVCAQGDARSTATPPALDEVRRALDAVEAGELVALAGGEPTLTEALPELIARAVERGATVLLQTNGRRLAYPTYVATLAEAAPRLALDVSLLGSTAAMHDYHTRTPGSFAQTAKGIRNATSKKLRVGVTVVVTRSNHRHLVDIVRLARALGADAIHLAPLEPTGEALVHVHRLTPSASLATPHMDAAVAEARRLGMQAVVGDPSTTELAARFAGTGPTAPW
jgi:MoaA/NifB/PqqE/SkfB family radical SAM enzyme